MAKNIKKRLGDSLVDADVISNDNLMIALKEQKKAGEKLGETLIRLGYCDEIQIIEVLSEQMDIPIIRMDRTVIDEETVKLINKDIAEKYTVMPLFKSQNTLNLAMADPLDFFVIDEIEFQTGLEVQQSIATKAEIEDAIAEYYGTSIKTDESLKRFDTEDEKVEKRSSDKIDITDNESNAPAIEIVNLILKKAVDEKASDIHIEQEAEELRVRFRIDGILHEVMKPPKNLDNAIVSRVKILAQLDIAEKRIPQDGRIELTYESKDIDIRLSTLPTVFGEKIVMRLLDKTNVQIRLEQLGFRDDLLKTFSKLLKRPNGIVLVTGPTGSGKTSTLYAGLNEINTLDKNIVTLENPVEYQLKIINQVQINPEVGLTFANGLRSILRQDPDVVMVGEIRDGETAEIAIEAAMTGHLVFSTLHTNSAAGTITRILDMGIEPFLVSSSLVGVMGQRLVRKICSKCKEEYMAPLELKEELNLDLEKEYKFYLGKGCKMCKNTGYKGRAAINELLVPDDYIRKLINQKASTSDILNYSKKTGFQTLRNDGLRKAEMGITSIEEVLRVTQDDI